MSEHHAGAVERDGHGRGSRYSAVGATVVVLMLIGAALAVVLAMNGGSGPAPGSDYEVVIAPGTAALADTGQEIEFFPPGFTMRVGQTLVIRNLDNATANIGPFTVGPGETLTKRFTEPGVIEGYCSYTDGERTFFEVVA